jgi:hypothetical protein
VEQISAEVVSMERIYATLISVERNSIQVLLKKVTGRGHRESAQAYVVMQPFTTLE